MFVISDNNPVNTLFLLPKNVVTLFKTQQPHAGTLAPSHTGILAHWHIGTLAHYHTGTLAHYHTGTLAHSYIIIREEIDGKTSGFIFHYYERVLLS